MIQITVPMEIADTIPVAPVLPVAFKINVVTISVAIAIPDTGLLLLPTIPTILDDTVAKKKPKTTIINAPKRLTGISGNNQIKAAMINTPPRTTFIDKSCCVLS
jgi:hypothetical protein